LAIKFPIEFAIKQKKETIKQIVILVKKLITKGKEK